MSTATFETPVFPAIHLVLIPTSVFVFIPTFHTEKPPAWILSPPSHLPVVRAKDLYNKLKTASPALAQDFDTRHNAWKQTWFSNSNRDSPNSDTRATGPEFAALAALGPKIIPFIINNKLETDLCYKLDPQDILNSKLAAADIINMNLTRNTDVQDALDRWAELRVQRQNYSSSFHFCDGEGYWALTDMGSSIIAQAMVEYYDDKHGWWHELLHELVHGRVSGAGVFFKDALFEEWKDWFEHRDHNDAPEGADERARREYVWSRKGVVGHGTQLRENFQYLGGSLMSSEILPETSQSIARKIEEGGLPPWPNRSYTVSTGPITHQFSM
ncbi:hypothetical protein Daus18300_009927 [Diaporthe australafricana]|uniref:Uncharacterized protein n=1 Tax=Diaporthe australafricana TaxID=127596 RepID=A0ABR3WCM6_9PEZI